MDRKKTQENFKESPKEDASGAHWSGMQTEFQVVTDTSENGDNFTEREYLFNDLHPVVRAGKRLKSAVRTSIIVIVLNALVLILDIGYETKEKITMVLTTGGAIYTLILLFRAGDDLTKFNYKDGKAIDNEP